MSKIHMTLSNSASQISLKATDRHKSKWSPWLEGFRLKFSSNEAKFQLKVPNPSKHLISATLQIPPSLFHKAAAENYISDFVQLSATSESLRRNPFSAQHSMRFISECIMSQSTVLLGYKIFQCLINKLIESIVIFLVFMQLTLSLIDRDEFEDIQEFHKQTSSYIWMIMKEE